MASFTYVQGTGNALTSVGTSVSATLTGVAAGDLIIVNACEFIISNSVQFTVTDNQGNTYSQDIINTTAYTGLQTGGNAILSTIALSSGTLTVTVSRIFSCLISFSVDEYSFTGGFTVSVDSTSTGFSTSGTTLPATGSLALSGSDLVIAGFDIRTTAGGLTYTAGTSFTLGFTENTAGAEGFVSEYDVNSTGGTITPGCTISSSTPWNGVSVAYKLVSSAVATIFDYDSSSSSDQQTIISHNFLQIDQSFSLDLNLLSRFLYQADKSFADQANDPVTSTPVILSKVSFDSGIGIESQSTHNVSMSIDSDSASGLESQFLIGQFFFGIEDTPFGSEQAFPNLISSDISISIEKQVFSSSLFYASDQASGSENQLAIITGGSSAVVYDRQPTAGLEGWLRIGLPTDLVSGRENDFMSSALFSTGLTDVAIGQESQLPIRLNGELPSAQEFQLKLITFFSTDSANSLDTFEYSQLIIQTDFARALEAYLLTRTFTSVGTGIIDSTTGQESQLPIRLYSDLSIEFENQARNTFGSSIGSITDIGTEMETSLRIISSLENPTVFDIQFVSYSTMSTSSAGIDSALGNESQLPIHLSGESSISIDQNLRIIIPSDIVFAIDTQTVFNQSILSGIGFTDSALASDPSIRYFLGGDFATVPDTGDSTTGQIPVPPPSTNTVADVIISILNYLQDTGIFGPNSVASVIDPDSIIKWPNSLPPLCLLEPLDMIDVSDSIGGGRFSKTWEFKFNIHVIVDNILDRSYIDSNLTTSSDPASGSYWLLDSVIKAMEQAYLINNAGQPTVIEFPFYEDIETIRRYKGSNSYSGIPIRFHVVFRENLPTLNIP